MNGGRLQTVEYSPEVIQFKRELQDRWSGRVFLDIDLETGEYAICGREGGNEYIIFHTTMLNDRTIQRIYEADQGSDAYVDVIDKLQQAWDKQDEDEDWVLSEIAGEAAERLRWAFKRDGLFDHNNIYGPPPKRRESVRAVRRGL
jgi:hypothetical protein